MYNNPYGFNPYMNQRFQNQPNNQPMPQQNIQPPMQPIQQYCSLLGKQVDSLEVVKAIDIPLDGSVNYFPLTNGSAIVTKQLQQDGTSENNIKSTFESADILIAYKIADYEEYDRIINKRAKKITTKPRKKKEQ